MSVAKKNQPHAGPDRAKSKHDERVEKQLDEALKDTFPASDPIAITAASIPRKPAHDDDKKRRDDC